MASPSTPSVNNTKQVSWIDLEIKDFNRLGFSGYVSNRWIIITQRAGDWTHNPSIMMTIAGGIVAIAIVLVIMLYTTLNSLNQKSPELLQLSLYDLNQLNANDTIRLGIRNATSLPDLISLLDESKKEQTKYNAIVSKLQQPYEHFLQYRYLPTLNIRKDPFLKTIDTNLLGIRFLEQNPYNDISLIQRRSRFFREMGRWQQFNDIQDIQIWQITEDKDGFFTMPITLSFTSPDKRSFLFLIDKISMTSQKQNIALINEFTTNLRDAISVQHAAVLSGLLQQWYTGYYSWEVSINKLIGAVLRQEIAADEFGSGWDSQVSLLTPEVIQSTIIQSAGCDALGVMDQEVCIVKFREKFRNIPQLAYSLTIQWADISSELKRLFREMPPLLAINNFSFTRQKNPQNATAFDQTQYKGQISLTIFGRGLSQPEYDEIAKELGTVCIGESQALTIEEWLNRIERKLLALWQTDSAVNSSESQRFVELKTIFTDAQLQFQTLTNYKKVIKLFEAYRMLDDGGLCKR